MNPYLFTNKINLKTLIFGSNNGEYYNSTSYKLNFLTDSKLKYKALWTNSPLVDDGYELTYSPNYESINTISFFLYKNNIKNLAKSISNNSSLDLKNIETELRLTGLYAEILHIMQYKYEFSLSNEYSVIAAANEEDVEEYMRSNSIPFGRMYGYNENEAQSKNLLNEQIRAVLEFRKNKNILVESNAFRPIYCARQLFRVGENLTDSELDARFIKYDPINLALITDYQIDITNIYCTLE
ncbi:MAG: hypothetical protein IPN79_12490 [Saprospiraceae bacterium]|nr:hypothetical protein [Saprospiraceae bacterium]